MKPFKQFIGIKEEKNESSTICVTVPLFIRLLEWAREDVKNDKALHIATENALEIHERGSELLGMEDYDKIIAKKSMEEEIAPANNIGSGNIAKFDPMLGKSKKRASTPMVKRLPVKVAK